MLDNPGGSNVRVLWHGRELLPFEAAPVRKFEAPLSRSGEKEVDWDYLLLEVETRCGKSLYAAESMSSNSRGSRGEAHVVIGEPLLWPNDLAKGRPVSNVHAGAGARMWLLVDNRARAEAHVFSVGPYYARVEGGATLAMTIGAGACEADTILQMDGEEIARVPLARDVNPLDRDAEPERKRFGSLYGRVRSEPLTLFVDVSRERCYSTQTVNYGRTYARGTESELRPALLHRIPKQVDFFLRPAPKSIEVTTLRDLQSTAAASRVEVLEILGDRCERMRQFR